MRSLYKKAEFTLPFTAATAIKANTTRLGGVNFFIITVNN